MALNSIFGMIDFKILRKLVDRFIKQPEIKTFMIRLECKAAEYIVLHFFDYKYT